MLFADLTANGELVVRGFSPLEKYALKQWAETNKGHEKLNIIVQVDNAYSVEDLTKMLGQDIEAFRKWHLDQQFRAVIPEVPEMIDDQTSIVIPSDTSHPSSMKAKCAMCGIILMKNETSVCRVCARRIEKAK